MTEDKTIRCVPHDQCTGCGACFNKCPKQAITMEYDTEGFLFPRVNDNCVNCGLCQAACPALHPMELHGNPKVYAVWADEETRAKSSSGGMFSLLARYVFERGGVVCGAAYADDYLSVYHIFASNEDELAKLRGSKYVQSDTEKTYSKTQELLSQGVLVLYTGCPCQIAGLYRYLGKDYSNLVTADIVCHGAPSPAVYKAFISEITGDKVLEKVDFREKAFWGWGTATSLFFTDGTIYRNDCNQDPYLKGFLSGLFTRKTCGKCVYTKLNRVGDFTLGDFWGIGTIDGDMDDKKGTSLVLVNSKKAQEIFSVISPSFTMAKKEKLDDLSEVAKTRNGRLRVPTPSHPNRDYFFMQTKSTDILSAMHRAQSKYRYDVGYVGWWDSKNYGSSLTCFAMNRTLKNMGFSVLMLEHPGIRPQDSYESYGMQFAKHFYECSKITKEKDFDRFNSVCENFVVGSDQLWNWWCNKDLGFGFYFLNFVNKNHRKIAYSTSFGSDWTSYPENTRLRVGYLLSRFDAISVREKSGVQICKQDFSADADWVLDPVFLCDMASYDEVAALSKKRETSPYLYAYILDPTEDKIAAVKFMAEKKNLPYRIAIDGLGNKSKLYVTLKNDPNIISSLRIEDWIYYIKNSSYMVTDSFHGFCFSLIFKKPSIAYINSHRGKARFDSIAEITGLEDRVVESFQDILDRKLWESDIDYTSVDARLAPKIAFSRSWLKAALTSRKTDPSVKELQLWKTLEHDRKINELSKEISELKTIISQQRELIDQLSKAEVTADSSVSTITVSSPASDMKDSFLHKLFRSK